MKRDRLVVLRYGMVRGGLALITLSCACLASVFFKIVPLEYFEIGGISGLKTIASIAVLGCLVAAFGYWDD